VDLTVSDDEDAGIVAAHERTKRKLPQSFSMPDQGRAPPGLSGQQPQVQDNRHAAQLSAALQAAQQYRQPNWQLRPTWPAAHTNGESPTGFLAGGPLPSPYTAQIQQARSAGAVAESGPASTGVTAEGASLSIPIRQVGISPPSH
jgi:hypothetical protein